MQPNYSLVELTDAEKESFTSELNALLTKHSVYFEPVPKFVRQQVGQAFTLSGDFLAMKKVELVPKGESVVSPLSEEMTKNDNPEASA